MNILVWISFVIAIACLLIVGRKSIWVALILAALIIGFFNITPMEILQEFLNTFKDTSVVFLALAVGLIPLIGGTLEETGLSDGLVKNLRIGRKWFVTMVPVLLGALPMPGGALLSAPILNKGAEGIEPETKVAINVWFRHIPLMIYPLGEILVVTKIAGLDLYKSILYFFPWVIIVTIVGYVFFIRKVHGKVIGNHEVNYKELMKPIICIFLAPAIHLGMMTAFPNIIHELPLLMGVIASLGLTIFFGKPGKDGKASFGKIIRDMRPWKFALIIIGMFFFLNVFNRSETAPIIAQIVINKTFFIVIFAAFMGFVTGRVQVPISILLPIYYAKFEISSIDYLTFSILFVSTFLGYLISPIHPCVSVSMEYFGTDLKQHFQKLTLPVSIILLMLGVFSLIFL